MTLTQENSDKKKKTKNAASLAAPKAFARSFVLQGLALFYRTPIKLKQKTFFFFYLNLMNFFKFLYFIFIYLIVFIHSSSRSPTFNSQFSNRSSSIYSLYFRSF